MPSPLLLLLLLRPLLLGAALAATAAAPPLPDPVRLKADLEFLCSADLAGRETGTPQAERAAAFLAERMGSEGLVPLKAGGLGGVTPFHFTWTYDGERAASAASDVVGVIPGVDPQVCGQFVFITAHYDHLGIRWGELYPGADDNASGTVALLEAARLLRHSRPRRSIAFLAVSGEEEGLLGSAAFLQAPPIPVAAIIAEINMDMVGRGQDGELHVMPAAIETRMTDLVTAARRIATGHGITLSAGIDGYWQRSDHYSFARRGIPSICLFSGMHADYHRPSDTPDKINYRHLATNTAIIRDLALDTANAPAAPAPVPAAVWSAWTWGPFEVRPGSR
jgi:hypothetical protein